ncbi:MAG: flagellar protein FliT [Armatimonadetes bacterium]|nr:flagellar protein FliT [Armatimonadota bacterium]
MDLCRDWLDCCRAQAEALGRSDWESLARIATRKEELQAQLETSDIPGDETPQKERALRLLEEACALETETRNRLDERMKLLAQRMRSLHCQRNARRSYRQVPAGNSPRYMDKRR